MLEFEVQKGLGIDRRTFSAQLQNVARRAAPDLFVMTQANIEQLVRASGKSLEECEGQCAVETGRLIGADLVVAGRISRIGKRWALSMHDSDLSVGRDRRGKGEKNMNLVKKIIGRILP